MAKLGFTEEAHVPGYVASIIRAGTPLYFDASQMKNHRIVAVRAATGMAVLEHKDQRGESVWSVVTAYAKRTTHGTQVGAVR